MTGDPGEPASLSPSGRALPVAPAAAPPRSPLIPRMGPIGSLANIYDDPLIRMRSVREKEERRETD